MEIISTTTVKATFDHQKQILQIKMKDQVVSADLRNSYAQALQFAKLNKVQHWLFDMSQIKKLSEQDQDWINSSFFPKVMTLQSFTNYFGMVLPEPCYQQLLDSVGKSGMKSYNSFIKIQTFNDPARALNWLTVNQA